MEVDVRDVPMGCYGFRLNCCDGSGLKRVVYLPYNQLSVVPVPRDLGWCREGYEFLGWANSAGKLCYMPGSSAKVPIPAGKVLDLFARWRLMPGYYEIRFFANDGTGRFRDCAFSVNCSSPLPQPLDNGWCRMNHVFKGWRNVEGQMCNNPRVMVANPETSEARLDLYAEWEPLCFELRFHSNDDTGRVRTFKFSFEELTSIQLPVDMGWKRQGFEFGGWMSMPNGGIVYPDARFIYKTVRPNDVCDIFAYWHPVFCMDKSSSAYARIKQVWREPIFKVEGMKKCKERIHELCIGSSHAHYGYFAEDGAFNLGDPSCDAYYSLHILKYWAERISRLSRVIFFYEVFNRGNIIDRGREGFRRIPWLYFYGIKVQTEDFRLETNLGENYYDCREIFFQCIDEHRATVPIGYRGNAIKRMPMLNVDIAKRVAMHLKLNKGDCDRYVSEMIDYCRNRKLELIIVVPPLRSDYVRELPLGFRLEPPTGARIINYMDSGLFVDDDFIDCDHLTEDGAKKLTRLLHEEVGEVRPNA